MAAYKRHKRRGERVDERCLAAARENSRKQRARRRAEAQPVREWESHNGKPSKDTIPIQQQAAYGKYEVVHVARTTDPLESARWRLYKVRAALHVAGPRDIAPLIEQERKTVEEYNTLIGEQGEKEKVTVFDELARKREERRRAAEQAERASA